MNLRRILNILVVVVVVVAVSAVSINFYNKSKLEAKDNNSFGEILKEKEEKVDSDKSTDKNDESKVSVKGNTTEEEKESIDTQNSSSETDSVSANPVDVESTSSFRNVYVAIIGGITIMLGSITVLVKVK